MTLHAARSLEIASAIADRRMIGVARELGLIRPTTPTAEGAAHLHAKLEGLGTTFIKLGQLLATRPDLVGELYATTLADLQDNVTSVPFEEVRDTIERSLGRPVVDLFASLDPLPLATASIAQTHRATLITGEHVVAKVRRPGIEVQVRADLELLASVVDRFAHRIDPDGLLKLRELVEELAWSLERELDMGSDAANALLIARNLTDFPDIVVPRVFEDMVTSEVLVMEYLEGERVVGAPIDAERGVELADIFLRAFVHQVLVDGTYHADPHAGNVLLTPAGQLGLLDFGLVGRIDYNTRMEVGLLLLALSEGRGEDVADLLLRMAITTRNSDVQVFHHGLRRVLPRYRDVSLGSVEVGPALIEIQQLAVRCGVSLPISFALIGKTLSQADAVARALDPTVRPMDLISSSVQSLVLAQARNLTHPSTALAMLSTPALAMLQLPRRTERLLERLERGEVTIGVAPTEFTDLIAEARTITNRMAASLMLAALVIASAMLMSVDNVGRILGYPALGFIGFCVATAGVLVLLWRMLRTDGGI